MKAKLREGRNTNAFTFYNLYLVISLDARVHSENVKRARRQEKELAKAGAVTQSPQRDVKRRGRCGRQSEDIPS